MPLLARSVVAPRQAIRDRPTTPSSIPGRSRSARRSARPSSTCRLRTINWSKPAPNSFVSTIATTSRQRDQAKANVDNFAAQIAAQTGKGRAGQEAGRSQAQAALTFAQQQSDRYQQLAQTRHRHHRAGAAIFVEPVAKPGGLRRRASQCRGDRKAKSRALERAAEERRKHNWRRPKPICRAPSLPRRSPAVSRDLTAAKGGYAAVGQALMMFVPRDVWVTANFKETQLDLMRPGQPVDIDDRRLSRPHVQRPCRQHPVRQRHRVQPAAGGKRDRQLRQDRAARAGQDRFRQAARRAARPRHVGRADRESAMSDQRASSAAGTTAVRPRATATRGSSPS